MKIHTIKVDPKHEDLIFSKKEFINELQKIQQQYIEDLAKQMNLAEHAIAYLEDFILNNGNRHEDFEDYLHTFNLKSIYKK